VGVKDLQTAHQEQRDAEHIDPMRKPHEQTVPIDQLLAAFGLSRGPAGRAIRHILIRNIDGHLVSKHQLAKHQPAKHQLDCGFLPHSPAFGDGFTFFA
jgi:hypothetical protein